MRILTFYDSEIEKHDLLSLQADFADFFELHTGITPTFYNRKRDYETYPTYVDGDGDRRPTPDYLQSVVDEVQAAYNSYGCDHVVLLIHEDNFLSSDPRPGVGIWGTAYANFSGSTHNISYCRWDKDNPANSFGTMYHEIHHLFDSLIFTHTSASRNALYSLLSIESGLSYDSAITHGRGANWSYINHKQNPNSLRLMSSLLKQAYGKRQSLHDDYMRGLTSQATSLMRRLIDILKAKLHSKTVKVSS